MFPNDIPGEEFINSWYPILIALAIGAVLGFRNYMRGPKCPSPEKPKDKVAIVTGGNRGIGKEIAIELAGRGARVIIACRDETSAEEAIKNINSQAKNKNTIFMKLDLTSFQSIRDFVATFNERESRLDYLVNNAAIMSRPYSETEDGHEIHLQTNFLGPFLLTHLLLTKMKETGGGRIINMIAPAYGLAEKEYFEDPNFGGDESKFNATKAYAGTKMALMVLTKAMAKQLESSKISCNGVIPGVVNTDLYNELPFRKTTFLRWSFAPLLFFLMKGPSDGAQVPLYCLIAAEEEGVTGKLYKDLKVMEPVELTNDPELEEKIYLLGAKLTGFKGQGDEGDEVEEKDTEESEC